jgi:hypothetical protein
MQMDKWKKSESAVTTIKHAIGCSSLSLSLCPRILHQHQSHHQFDKLSPINVSMMTGFGFVFNVRGVDGNLASLFFGGAIDIFACQGLTLQAKQ